MALGGTGPVATVAREHVQDILAEDSFEITMDLRGSGSGDLFRIHTSLIASVTANGSVKLVAYSVDGTSVTLTSTGVNVADGAKHNVAFTYAGDQLKILVDGVVVDSTTMAEPLAANGNYDLVFGNPWSGGNFNGTMESFNIGLVPGASASSGTFQPSTPVVTAPAPTPSTVTGVSPTPQTTQAPTDTGGSTPPAPAPSAPTPPADTGTQPAPSLSHILTLLQDGRFMADDNGAALMLAGGDSSGIDLGTRGTAASVDRAHVTDILGNDSFEISLTLSADEGPAPGLGDVFRLQGSLIVQVRSNGDMLVRAFASDGDVARISTSGVDFYDHASHDVSLRYQDGVLEVWADGVLVGDAELSAPLANTGRHDLVFGNPWKGKNFNGTVEHFDVSTDPSSAPQTDSTPAPVVDNQMDHLHEVTTAGLYSGTMAWHTASDVTDSHTNDALATLHDDGAYGDAPFLLHHPLDL